MADTASTITRILVAQDGKYYYQRDRKDVSTHFGVVRAADINDAPDGAEVKSNTSEKFSLLTPTFLDHYRRLTRGPQIMLLKDLGVIAAETGLGPESIVGDAGTGSGAAAAFFARLVKHVYSFDTVPEHTELGKKNAVMLGLTNITFTAKDIYEGIPAPSELNADALGSHSDVYDLFLWDNPEPWRALPFLDRIAIGGWMVAYLPSINQTAAFANAVQEHPQLQYRKTVEIIERDWAVKGQRVRPSSESIGHTGFLVFARRLR